MVKDFISDFWRAFWLAPLDTSTIFLKMKIYVGPQLGWLSGVFGFDSLHPLQFRKNNRNNSNYRCWPAPDRRFCFSSGNSEAIDYAAMFWDKKDKDRNRFYLLPGQGGRNLRRKRRAFLRWSLLAGIIASALLACCFYLMNHY